MTTTELPTHASSTPSDDHSRDPIEDVPRPLPFPTRQTSHDSNSTPTQTPTVSQTPRIDAEASNGTSVVVNEYADESRNTGLGMGTPLPPAPHAAHASTTHLQPSPITSTHIITESPSSIGSTVPHTSLPALASAPNLPYPRRPPSPPLPSLPLSTSRLGQRTVSRSNTGPSVQGRTLSFADPPKRSPSGSDRAGNGNGNGQNYTSNARGSSCRQSDRRTMSSIATSMEKAGLVLEAIEANAPRPYHIDLGYGDRSRDNRYHDSAIAIPMPTYDRREGDFDATDRGRIHHRRSGGDGGDGGGGPGTRPHRDNDSIHMPKFPRTVQERLQPTIDHAAAEEIKYARKAKLTGYALNTAIGLQIFISAFITGLAAITTGRQTSIVTAILGGFGTVVGSYLARARGSNEPELSISRTRDLQRFIRTCDAFVQDHGQETTGIEGDEEKRGPQDIRRARELDERIKELRNELEHLLGNGDG